MDTGFVPSLAPLINSDTNSGSKYGSSTSSSISVSDYYGNMSVTGSGSSINSAQQGSFAWIDTALGGAPITKYEDYLNVTSSTLAVGTDVTIGFTESFTGSATVVDPLVATTVTFADDLLIYDNSGDRWTVSLTSTGSASYFFHTKVGDTVNLSGDMHIDGAAAYTNLLSPILTSDFSFSASGPLSITSVTDGVDLVSGSGASYTPTASVPDVSGTLGMLGGALAGLAALRRRFAK